MRAADALRLGFALLLGGCAAAPDAESRVAPPPPLDAPAPPAQAVAEERERSTADDEFAEYERLLAEKETRLRAAGVLLARREEAKPATDARFAAPPPAPADAVASAPGKVRRDVASGRTAAAPRPSTAPSAAGPAAPIAVGGLVAETKAKKPAKGERAAQSRAGDAATAEDDEAGGRCQLICDLADATCDLESKICDLAARHPGDARYGDLCRRAEDDCRLAADACQQCSP